MTIDQVAKIASTESTEMDILQEAWDLYCKEAGGTCSFNFPEKLPKETLDKYIKKDKQLIS